MRTNMPTSWRFVFVIYAAFALHAAHGGTRRSMQITALSVSLSACPFSNNDQLQPRMIAI